MSVRLPRSTTPMEATDAAPEVDWTTVTDDELEPLPTDTVEVELAKIDEKVRRQREQVLARRRQQEEERLRREAEEQHRQASFHQPGYYIIQLLILSQEEEQRRRDAEERRRLAEESARKRRERETAEQPMVGEEEDAEAEEEDDSEVEVVEGDVTTMHNASRASSTRVSNPRLNRAYVLIPSKSSAFGRGTPIKRERPCMLCVISGKPCVDLPDSRSKQCARCLRQKRRCRPSSGKVHAKRKGNQVSPRGGDKRKRPKNLPDNDDEIQFMGSTTAKAGPSACTAPDPVAQVLDRRLGELTALLRDLVTKVDNLAGPKGKSGDVDESADDDDDDSADEEATPEWSGDEAA
ncbi:hypothetical protein PISMIDRAFT_18400 [Pisolithus microcarpus 441]|uniref:Uncharacterized protein n=1 Tax=Pisolithus microcarpus 441 TaxID=765257 RepID=A0A0C9Y7I8_9AGAM|nr:hypothetical protein BKA83DRAFT_18400 [Pisolithus microcarpus]KIK12886.1 hypothetical protein PISMIDRAFT_18400 [Pisolithus microcarpus 441]